MITGKTIVLSGVLLLLLYVLFGVVLNFTYPSMNEKSAPKQIEPLPKNTGKSATISLHYADWCGACKMYKSEWNRLKEIVQKSYPNIKTAEIDCEVDDSSRKMCFNKGITGYPTISISKTRDGNTNEYLFMKSRKAERIIEDALL